MLIGVSGSGQVTRPSSPRSAPNTSAPAFGDIRVRGGDTTLVPYGYGTGASRVAVNTGNAVAEAAAAVATRPCARPRGSSSAHRPTCGSKNPAFVIGAPARAIPLGQLARVALRERGAGGLGGPGSGPTRFYAPPTVTWSSRVLAVVEVDAETGRVAILRYVIVHDCGRQLHPVIVDGQIVGGFAQELGVVLVLSASCTATTASS